MNTSQSGPLSDATARKVSPALFILVLICFVLPFVGVSCNTDKAQQALSGLASGFGGSGSSSSSNSMTACLDALKGKDLVTFTGLNLVMGSDPSVIKDAPAGCDSSGSPASAASTNASQVNIGVQPLAILALAVILVGLVSGALKVSLRGAVAAAMALLAAVLLLFEQSRAAAAIFDKLNASAGSGASLGISASDYFNSTLGIGLILMLVVLVIAAAYNAMAFFLARRDNIPVVGALATPAGTPPPITPPPTSAAPPPPAPPAPPTA